MGGVGAEDQRHYVGAQETATANNEYTPQWLLGLRGNRSHCVYGSGSGVGGVEVGELKSGGHSSRCKSFYRVKLNTA